MGKTHFFLSGKGGIGKSFAASILVQHFQSDKKIVLCMDNDPGRTGLSNYQAYQSKNYNYYEKDTSDPRSTQSLFKDILSDNDCAEIVVDSSNASFLAICQYLKESNFLEEYQAKGNSVYLHSNIVGDASCEASLSSFRALMENYPSIPVVVWLNEYFGKIRIEGEIFEKSRFFNEYRNRIHGVIQFGPFMTDQYEGDTRRMLIDYQTFEQAIENIDYGHMCRARLRDVWDGLNAQLYRLDI